MCHEILSQADMKAIATARKFDKESLLSRDKFEKYYNSVVGVQEAIESLTENEKVFLFYMGTESRDIEFFTPLYQKEGQIHSYGTYTQKYGDVHRLIHNNLVKKGILAVREVSYGASKMERWRFNVPLLFMQYLKGIITNTYQLEIQGTVSDTILRKKISECVKTSTAKDLSKNVHLKANILHFGENRFSFKAMDAWRINQWVKESIDPFKENKKAELESKFKHQFIENLQKLNREEWFKPCALRPILKFLTYGYDPIESEKVCEIGFYYGFLKKTISNGESLYAKADILNEQKGAQNLTPESYLQQEKDGFLVELNNIPYSTLEQLAQYGHFSVLQNKLMLRFEFSALVKMDTDFLCSPLLGWMREKLPLLEHQVNQIQLKHGKIFLHKNLIMAKINDLRLKAQLVKACQNMKDVLFLPNDFLAFPKSYKLELERIIKKNGYAIRTN